VLWLVTGRDDKAVSVLAGPAGSVVQVRF